MIMGKGRTGITQHEVSNDHGEGYDMNNSPREFQ